MNALWKIGKIRYLLDENSAEKLIHAFVTSRLDYCNSLLSGISNYHLKKLQIIQNSAARLVTRTKRRESITPVLQELHWLPVEQRIQFKILCHVFKIVHGMAPVYVEELLERHAAVRTLRSSNAVNFYYS